MTPQLTRSVSKSLMKNGITAGCRECSLWGSETELSCFPTEKYSCTDGSDCYSKLSATRWGSSSAWLFNMKTLQLEVKTTLLLFKGTFSLSDWVHIFGNIIEFIVPHWKILDILEISMIKDSWLDTRHSFLDIMEMSVVKGCFMYGWFYLRGYALYRVFVNTLCFIYHFNVLIFSMCNMSCSSRDYGFIIKYEVLGTASCLIFPLQIVLFHVKL